MILPVTPSPTTGQPAASPQTFRLDPCPSKVFSWMEHNPSAPEIRDEITNRLVQPAGPTLHIRYRYNGAEWVFFPVSLEEARQVMNPGAAYDYSIGAAFSSIIKAHKSGRRVKTGERQITRAQREQIEQRAGRRWLA
jgi:hypothetical protein